MACVSQWNANAIAFFPKLWIKIWNAWTLVEYKLRGPSPFCHLPLVSIWLNSNEKSTSVAHTLCSLDILMNVFVCAHVFLSIFPLSLETHYSCILINVHFIWNSTKSANILEYPKFRRKEMKRKRERVRGKSSKHAQLNGSAFKRNVSRC